MHNDYKVKYRVVSSGDIVELISITPKSILVEGLFFDGELFTKVYLGNDGVFELDIKLLYEDEYIYSGVVGLKKVRGR